jgi:uncharacterized membrane protein YhiD involved in acid resistance
MPWVEFCNRVILALMIGGVIGFERQGGQRLAGRRTNPLVYLGLALKIHSRLREDANNTARVEISARMAGTGTAQAAME